MARIRSFTSFFGLTRKMKMDAKFGLEERIAKKLVKYAIFDAFPNKNCFIYS